MKAAVLSLLAAATIVAADGDYEVPSTTSTVYATSIYTITSCAPEVTDCPAKIGQVTTDYVSLYTTVCPVEAEATVTIVPYPAQTGYPVDTGYPVQSGYPANTGYPMGTGYPVESAKGYPIATASPYPINTANGYSTSTFYKTIEYTVTACPPYVTNCPVGKKTSSVITSTSVCAPTATAVYEHEQEGEYTTSTIYMTKEYTITACKAEVTNCPVGKKTYDVYTTTTVCPVSQATALPVVKTYAAVVAPVQSTSCSLSTVTYSTCVPSYYTSVITVYPTTTAVVQQVSFSSYAATPMGTGAAYPAGYPASSYPKGNGTYMPYSYTGGAAAQKAGGLLAAVGLAFAALL